MEEVNKDFKAEPAFVMSIYDRFGMYIYNQFGLTAEERAGAVATLDEISQQIFNSTSTPLSRRQWENIRKELWEKADDNIRTELIIGALDRGARDYQYEDQHSACLRDSLYFSNPEELTNRIAGTTFAAQAADYITAANHALMSTGYIPAPLLKWNAAVYENASPAQQSKIKDSFPATHFGYFSYDSENDEPYRHSVELILTDDKFPKGFRAHAIELALREIEGDWYEELQAALGRTYRAMPEQFSLDAAVRIRKIAGMSEIEGSHEETIARDRQEQAEKERSFLERWNRLMSSATTHEKNLGAVSQIIDEHLLKRTEGQTAK